MFNINDIFTSVISNDKILEMIIQNKTIEEISQETGLSYKQLYRRITMLKNEGYNIKENYYHSGNMLYQLNSNYNYENININMEGNQKFKAMLISDLHFCSLYETVAALDKIYDYCIKNDIHIIINAGDLINGVNTEKCPTDMNLKQQVEQALRQYPFDKNILNFIVLGNHDVYLLEQEKIDMRKIIKNERHDIVPLGYQSGILKISNDFIKINHPFFGKKCNNKAPGFIIYGHFHMQQIVSTSNYVHVFLPALSTLDQYGFNMPKAIEMTLSLNNNYITKGNFETLLVQDKVYKISETRLEFLFNKDKIKQKTK